jgi:hypothetical protein
MSRPLEECTLPELIKLAACYQNINLILRGEDYSHINLDKQEENISKYSRETIIEAIGILRERGRNNHEEEK